MKMLIIIGIFIVGIVYHVECQSSLSLPEPLFSRGCRAQRGQFAHETYCWQYYNCWDGRATIEECPGRLHFNQVIGQCDYAEQVNCGNRLRNPDPSVTADGRCLKQFGIFPDQTDCTAFYECSFGRAYRQVCPYYTAFDERFSVCVHAHEVDCGGRGGIYGTLSPPLYGNDVGGNLPLINLPGSGPAASDLERQYEKPISPEATFRCPQPRGLYPSAVDCSRFWLCREYKPSLLKCPTGQLFDLASLSCTYPEKAQCSSLIPRT
ncbi:chondroitin proteoglycan-2-like [Uloborus diversus]|uniref:chondroitin proteoglycan-2-like n=1 Tax=Uloborus diversus TaxID=327109 RepID=UPI00240A5D3D|nr:chondroitin proteoglycan-2-like [Uloborus diversus]